MSESRRTKPNRTQSKSRYEERRVMRGDSVPSPVDSCRADSQDEHKAPAQRRRRPDKMDVLLRAHARKPIKAVRFPTTTCDKLSIPRSEQVALRLKTRQELRWAWLVAYLQYECCCPACAAW